MRRSASCVLAAAVDRSTGTGGHPRSSRGSVSSDALRQTSLVWSAAPFWPGERFCEHRADQTNHRLELRSSREGVEPLQLKLDDAELADLVRCLDRLRLDHGSS